MILKIIAVFRTVWYWIFCGLFLLVFFVSQGHSVSQVFYFITSLLPIVIGTSYYLNNKLIPEFLIRKKLGLFILYSIYTLIISLYLQYLVIFLALYIYTLFQLDNHSLLTMDVTNLNLTLYLLVLVKVLIDIVQKLIHKETIIKGLEDNKEKPSEALSEKIVIRYNRVNHPLTTSKILYIESLSDYIKIVTEDDDLVTKENISKIINRLPPCFKRTHRSFIINSNKVHSFNKEFVTIENVQIPISRTYKKELLMFLNQL